MSAQEAIVNDEATPYPFKGVLEYSISIKDANGKHLNPLRADSMTLSVSYPNLRADMSGGIADSLAHSIVWNAKSGETSLLYPKMQLYYGIPLSYSKDSSWSKAGKLDKKVNGIACKHIVVRYANSKVVDEYWISDSLYISREIADSILEYSPSFIGPGNGSLPLEMKRTNGKVITTTRVTKITSKEIGKEEFLIPSNYEEGIWSTRPGIRHPITTED